MAQDDVVQPNATAVMTIGSGRTYSPQRTSKERSLERSIPVALVEVLAQVVAFEVREDVLDQERISQGQLQIREPAAIVHVLIESGGGGEHTVEDAISLSRVVHRLYVGHATVVVDSQIRNVAGRAANLGEYRAASVGRAVLDVVAGFEVVQQVELQMIHKCGIDLASIVVGRGGRTDLVLGTVQHHSRRSYHAASGAGREQIGIGRVLHPQLVVQRDSDELAN